MKPIPSEVSRRGLHLIDGKNVTLGTVVSSDRDSTVVLTSTGYQVDIPYSGTFNRAQIYYTGPSCTGTAYLNDPSGGGTMSGKWLVYSGSQGTLMAPATVANGVSTGEAMTSVTIDNPDCSAAPGDHSGWKLTPITRAAAGLPAAIARPLKVQ